MIASPLRLAARLNHASWREVVQLNTSTLQNPVAGGLIADSNQAAKKEDPIGGIAQTWELVGKSFAILKSDKELMLLPIFSGAFCVLVSVVILGGGGLLFVPETRALKVTAVNRHS